MSTAVSEAA